MNTLPHTCPHCGESFGWGTGAGLLCVMNSVPFDVGAPCCGEQIKGRVVNGVIEFNS